MIKALFLAVLIFSQTSVAKCPRFLAQLLPLSRPSPEVTRKLKEFYPRGTFVVSAADSLALQKVLGISENQLMIELIPLAKMKSQPHISKYQVGAVARTNVGNLLLGTNIEFPGGDPNGTIHGEHFLIASAFLSGQKQIEKIALSAAPCGLCRQMINETTQSQDIEMLYPGKYAVRFSKVLPGSFGPRDLGANSELLNSQWANLQFASGEIIDHPAQKSALNAARRSYSPYINMVSGITLVLDDGLYITGSHLENAAFQKISALNVALVNMVLGGHTDFSKIKRAELVIQKTKGPQGSEIDDTRSILSKIAPQAGLRVTYAESKK